MHLLALAIAVSPAIAIRTDAQVQSVDSKHKQNAHIQESSRLHEDNEMTVRIPRGWRVLPDPRFPGNESVNPSRTLRLERNGYLLSLAYHEGHASGIEGGRFIEAFDMRWPGLDDAWSCSGYLLEDAQPASRHFVFVNLIVNTGDENVRKNCAIRKNLGSWVVKNGTKQYAGEFRWFGGYFRTAYGGYFFGPDDDGCAQKVYTLTSEATSLEKLPFAESPFPRSNPGLEKVIEEAIDIVNSIHYKQCSPF